MLIKYTLSGYRQKNRPVGKATISYWETKPPKLTRQETKEELIALRDLAFQVVSEFYENNPEIDLRSWRFFIHRWIMTIRGVVFSQRRLNLTYATHLLRLLKLSGCRYLYQILSS